MPGKGFTTVTIRKDAYQKLKESAQSEGLKVSKKLELLVAACPIFPWSYLLLGPPESRKDLIKVTWPESQWSELRKTMFTVLPARTCKLTAWVKFEAYPKKIGPTQFTLIPRLLKDGIQIQKIIIIAADLWNKAEIWKWTWKWIALQWAFEDRVKVSVVQEEKIPQDTLKERNIDTGIFDDRFVDSLKVSETAEPIEYAWIYQEQQQKAIIEGFERLKTLKVKPQSYPRFDSLST